MKAKRSSLRTAVHYDIRALENRSLRGLAAVLVVAAIGMFVWPGLGERASTPEQAVTSPDEDSRDGVVRFTAAKRHAAALHVSKVESRVIRESRRVPGKIGYNASRRLEVKVPASGVVTRVLVLPGQAVERGDPLAMLASAEVGMAHEEMEHAEADLHIAEREADWLAQIAANTKALLGVLDDSPEVVKVEEEFANQVLGIQREKIIAADSKLRLANQALDAAISAEDALSERYVQERASAREIADANFRSTCERARFDTQQQLARSLAYLEHARHMLIISRQKVRLLLGAFAEISPGHDDDTLCELILRSPLDGQVADRFVSDGAQFAASQALFVLANTDTLWVSAQIYQREWSALAGGEVKEVNIETPALPAIEITATVHFFGLGMSGETRSVPLIAELPNPKNQFKPGMFARVDVPLGPPHEALVVPARAMMRHEGEAFVFIEAEPGEYRKVVVTPGLATSEFVEVLSGLDAGANVVDRGAFFLKSELLLEGEEP